MGGISRPGRWRAVYSHNVVYSQATFTVVLWLASLDPRFGPRAFSKPKLGNLVHVPRAVLLN